MVSGDSIIGFIVVAAFFLLIGSRIYKHEKEHIDPMIAKVKGWFSKDESGDGESFGGTAGDYELEFVGQMK